MRSTARRLPYMIGEVRDWHRADLPPGWMWCAGAAIPAHLTYARSLIGNNVPDYRGRVAVGRDNLGGTSAGRITAAWAGTLGNAGGEEKHTPTIAELAAHTHAGAIKTNTGNDQAGGASTYLHVTTATSTGSNGSSTAHNVVQPSMATNKIIYVGAS